MKNFSVVGTATSDYDGKSEWWVEGMIKAQGPPQGSRISKKESLCCPARWKALKVKLRWCILCVLLVSLTALSTSCGTQAPCEGECQKYFFACFAQLHRCAALCEGSAEAQLECQVPPTQGTEDDKVTQVFFGASDCERCQTAYKAWSAGKDCEEGQRRCAFAATSTGVTGHLLQVCVKANSRWIWSEGRECDEGDTYPCVNGFSGPTCLGCQADSDCKQGESCDPTTKRCIMCVQDQDCPDKDKSTCSTEGRCVQCASDPHCASNLQGTVCIGNACGCQVDSDCSNPLAPYCGQDNRCVPCLNNQHCARQWWSGTPYCGQDNRCGCSENKDCQAIGMVRCEDRSCVGCQTNQDCQSFGAGAICTLNRCQTPCKRDSDCSLLRDGTCISGRCATGCTKDSDCNRFQLPFCRERRCVQCRQDDDCPQLSRFCAAPRFVCVQCRTQQDCPVGQRCLSGECQSF